MRTEEARPLLAMVAGYWPTPVMTDEEAAAWLREMASPIRITYEEAQSVIVSKAHFGVEFRPRPGQLVADVQALRRQRARDHALPALQQPIRNDGWDREREACLRAWRLAVGRSA